MAQLATPLVSNTVADHQSLSVSVNGIIYSTVSEFSYGSTIDRGEHRGTAPNILAYTDGTVSCEGSFTLPLYDWYSLIEDIADSNGQWGTARFDVTATWKTQSDSETKKVVLKDCMINGAPTSTSSGPDAVTVTVDLAVRAIEEVGLTAYADNV